MYWFFKVRHRLTIASFFGIIVSLIIVGSLVSIYQINNIFLSFKSMHNERLIPAIEVSNSILILFENKLDLDKHFLNDDSTRYPIIKKRINERSRFVKDKLSRYASAPDMNELDSEKIKAYWDLVKQLNEVNYEVMKLSESGRKEEARKYLFEKGNPTFDNAMEIAKNFSDNQRSVGNELFAMVDRKTTNGKIVSYALFGSAMVFVIITAFLLSFYYQEDQ